MDIKTVLGISAVVVGFIGYAPYLRDTFRGTTKPHFFSWFLWGILETIAFFAQMAEGAGIGAWVTGFSVIIVYTIAAKAFFNKNRYITRFDWMCFVGALLGIIIWPMTGSPAAAAVVVTITDAVAFLPTYRKGFERPYEETVEEYMASAIKYALGIAALATYTIGTTLYPASLVVTNVLFITMILLRRRMKTMKGA